MATYGRNQARTSSPSPDPDEATPEPARRRSPSRTSSLLAAIRANRTGRIALKVGVALAGALVVAVGAALIPLPGPGWLIVLAGLAIWAVEFAWAKHLLHFTRAKLRRWTRWVAARPWPTRLAIGAAGLAFVAVVVWLSVRYSFGVDLWATCWEYVTTH
ncbi:PGPGW domain-containing protein [Rhizomonospora bruguierae]|uniref:PGPGW domain-containing protein n=1 Tax=Rhizomonospora bruguierae TaxID=1581705 RepID=UPI001BCFE81E|nr:PGPGW domain-containing protein [Micromonospora sp. NBRC 107566]